MNGRIAVQLGVLLIAVGSIFGCGKSADKSTVAATEATDKSAVHGEWWCNEHGVPEEICAQCSTKLAAEFKAKGDWCAKHDRPDSQCFICHPEKQVEFAALYEAKYGKQPPKPQLGGEGHDEQNQEQKKS
jgi:hypothetical protein